MGKSSKNKPRNNSSLAKPKQKNHAPAESHDAPDTRITKILENLKSAVPEQRLFGLEAVATIASGTFDDRCQALFDSGIIRLTGPLLLDSDISIRKAASGVIRNLSTLSKECVDKLVEQDILTPVIALFRVKYTKEWKPITKKAIVDDSQTGTLADDEEMDTDKPPNKIEIKLTDHLLDEHTDTFVQAVHILWNICENNSEAVKHFNQADIVDLIARCLDPSIYPPEVTLAVGQFINTIIEDNYLIKPKLVNYHKLIVSLLTHPGDSPADIFLRVLAAGIACNLNLNDAALSALKCIQSALNFDHRRVILEVTNSLATTEVDTSDQAMINLNREIMKCMNLLDAQTVSLEMLANLCLPFDDQSDKGDPMDGDWSSGSDEETMEETLLEAAAVDRSYYSDDSNVLLGALTQAQLPRLILERTQALAENEYQTLAHDTKGHPILEKINELRSRSFYCLNNIIEALDIAHLGGIQVLYTLCVDLSKLIVLGKDENPKILEASSTALTAGLRKFISLNDKSNLECFKEISEDDMKALQMALLNNSESNILANLIRVLGLYGQISLHIPNSSVIIKMCGSNLLDIATSQDDIWLLSEALDSLMDIFGEDETDDVAYTIGLVSRLKSLHSLFKHKFHLYKKNQRKNQPHQDIISTVNSNLMRFIRYKSDRLKKYNI